MTKTPRLGQHFLVSEEIRDAIVEASDVGRNDTILEIGPGKGALTLLLASRCRRVIAVERDPELARGLSRELRRRGVGTVEVIEGDILTLFPEGLPLPPVYRVVANIPYYLTGRLIRTLLESDRRPSTMTLMVQKEVALRITASPPRMNLLAIASQTYADPRVAFVVPRSSFAPPPRVESAVVIFADITGDYFRRHGIAPETFFRIAKAAFSGKRKQIGNSLSPITAGREHLDRVLADAGINRRSRPEDVSLQQWALLARHYERIRADTRSAS